MSPFVSAADVQAELSCSRTTAYEWMRAALGRVPGARGLLRVPRPIWDRHVLLMTRGAPEPAPRSCKPSAPRNTAAVYFLQHGDDGPVKIGYAADVALRARLLQGGNPYQLHLRGFIKTANLIAVEAALHARFSDARMGGEWFRPTPALLAYIATETTRWP